MELEARVKGVTPAGFAYTLDKLAASTVRPRSCLSTSCPQHPPSPPLAGLELHQHGHHD